MWWDIRVTARHPTSMIHPVGSPLKLCFSVNRKGPGEAPQGSSYAARSFLKQHCSAQVTSRIARQPDRMAWAN